jgi:DNA repair protein RadC
METQESRKVLQQILDESDKDKWPPADALTRRRKERQAERDALLVPVKTFKMMSETTLRVPMAPRPPLTTPQKALAIFREYLKDADREIVAVLCMNTKLEYIGIGTAAMGGLDHVMVDPAEVFKIVLCDHNAASFMVAHNHPSSGDPTPSDEDYAMLADIRRIGLLLTRPMRDFIIIGDGTRYYSHREINLEV